MPRRARQVPDTDATRALDLAVIAYDQAEMQLQKAIIEAAREAAQPGSKLTFAEIARRTGYSREHVSRVAGKAGIRQRPPKDSAEAE